MSFDDLQTLSPARRRLVELMRHMQFGRIEGLLVQGGEPVFQPPPRVIRAVKLCVAEEEQEQDLHRKMQPANGALKSQVRRLLRQFDALGNGRVECLEVQNGLPFRLAVEAHHRDL